MKINLAVFENHIEEDYLLIFWKKKNNAFEKSCFEVLIMLFLFFCCHNSQKSHSELPFLRSLNMVLF